MNRRNFLETGTALIPLAATMAASGKPAILGGKPVRKAPFPSWPVSDQTEEHALLSVLREGRWNRGSAVERFEQKYAAATGAKACLATANGTSALLTSINVLGIGPGDEVIVPPYTFIATVNVVLQVGALPVFADTDPATLQVDPATVDSRITAQTRAIIPVHLGGSAADLDRILSISRKHSIPVVEDACQAHMAEWRGRKVGTYGTTGCFSFQASKNLNSGEGGAVISNQPELIDRCFAFHNNSRARSGASSLSGYAGRGLNLRLTEFQAALLLAQMGRLEQQMRLRDENAAHLTKLLNEIPGIRPARMYEGCTRNAWHLYMLRYDAQEFAGLPRNKFLKALRAEGIPAGSGYTPLNREPFLKATLSSPGYKRIYGEKRLAAWFEGNNCPANDRLCKEAVWFTQTMLLGNRTDMEQIATALHRIQRNAAAVKSASV